MGSSSCSTTSGRKFGVAHGDLLSALPYQVVLSAAAVRTFVG
jgi:hypothetical protein